MRKFDFIVAIHDNQNNDYDCRLRNLQFIIDSISNDLHMILIEHVKSNQERNFGEKLHFRDNVTYIKKIYDGEFNKGWLYNIGYKHSKTENLILGEADINIPPLYLSKIDDFINKNNNIEWFICWDFIYYLDKDLFGYRLKTDRRGSLAKKPGAMGGLVYFKKSFYERIGGANEWFERIGGIDQDLCRRADYFSGYFKRMPGIIYHYWHPVNKWREESKSDDNEYYKDKTFFIYMVSENKNKDIFNRISTFSKEIGGDEPLCKKINIYDDIDKSKYMSRKEYEKMKKNKKINTKKQIIRKKNRKILPENRVDLIRKKIKPIKRIFN